jgi:TatD DNase family protein
MLIDSHAHLQDVEFREDFAGVLERAVASGVSRIVLIGEDTANSRNAIQMASPADILFATVGVHPHHAGSWNRESCGEIEGMAHESDKVVAVGEVGIDYHYDFSPRNVQIDVFLQQMDIATRLSLPAVIHCREAYPEMLELLRNHVQTRTSVHAGRPAGIMHCYFGSVSQAFDFIELGFLLGIGGAATFKKAEELHEVIRQVPLEHLVLETDAPYMAPVPHRGKRNEPAYLPLVAERVAELKDVSPNEVARSTTLNAARVFGW